MIGLYNREVVTDDFCVGYVLDFDENFVIMQQVTEYGEKDGILIKQIETLNKIETRNDYLNGCQTLLKNPHPLPAQTSANVKISPSEVWQYHFLNENSILGEMMSFDLIGDEFYNFGFLVDFDEENIIILLVGQGGESLGRNVYQLSDIASFGIDTLQCRKRRYLYNLKKKINVL